VKTLAMVLARAKAERRRSKAKPPSWSALLKDMRYEETCGTPLAHKPKPAIFEWKPKRSHHCRKCARSSITMEPGKPVTLNFWVDRATLRRCPKAKRDKCNVLHPWLRLLRYREPRLKLRYT